MKHILKSIRKAEIKFDAGAEKFAVRHPYLTAACCFTGIPILVVGAVALCAAAVAYPVSCLCGWI